MIEIPEAITLSNQINETLRGKRIDYAIANNSPHKFAWYFGDPSEYHSRLSGEVVEKSNAFGGYIEISLGDTILLFSDGVNLQYCSKGENVPIKHQLLIKFHDQSYLIASIQMYGGIWCFRGGEFDNIYYKQAKEKVAPLSDEFDFKYFEKIVSDEALKKKSVKALLATEQRIPGLGNGVLQDILFNAEINPKRKTSSLSNLDLEKIFHSIKATLNEMTIKGGRDTEKNLFGCNGGYTTKLSKKTVNEPCRICGGTIIKENYMGGSIYYCEGCQKE